MGLADMIFTFLDPGLLSTSGGGITKETNIFHMASGKMTVTLDDVCYLLHLPDEGRRPKHQGILMKAEGVEMMVQYIRASPKDAIYIYIYIYILKASFPAPQSCKTS
jgi:hypothetical protein